MNRFSSQLLRKEFPKQLQACAPGAVKVANAEVPSGCVVYDLKWEGPVTFFLDFQPDEKRDQFTVELRWSIDGEYPVYARLEFTPDEAVALDSSCIRISSLWSNEDYWWKTPLQRTLAEARSIEARMDRDKLSDATLAKMKATAEEQVADVMAKVKEYVFPFMHRVIEAHSKKRKRKGG